MIALVTTPRSLVHFSIASEPRMLFGLAHLVEPSTFEGEHYADQLMAASVAGGAHLIIDNGVTETGTAMSIDELSYVALAVQANEVVLPDVFGDAEGTRELVAGAVRELSQQPHVSFGGMAVVHETPATIARTLETWAKHRIITTLGVPKRQTISPSWRHGRLSVLQAIESLGAHTRFEVHMLGVWEDMHEVRDIAQRYPWVRSIDTSWPVMAGVAGVDIVKHPGRKVAYEAEPSPRLSREQVDMIWHNIDVYRRWANGKE